MDRKDHRQRKDFRRERHAEVSGIPHGSWLDSEFTRNQADGKSAVVVAEAVNQDSFRLLFELSGDPMWLFDPSGGVFVDCNRAAVELMRARGKDDLLPRRPDELSPEFQPEGIRSRDRARLLELLSRDGGFTHQEIRYRRKDGSSFWGLSSSRAVYAADGRAISYHVGTIQLGVETRSAATLRALEVLSAPALKKA